MGFSDVDSGGEDSRGGRGDFGGRRNYGGGTSFGSRNNNDNKPEELSEEELRRREEEQKRRLTRRIDIAENGANRSARLVWQDSPTHSHDAETFSSERDNPYGKLRYNLSESEKKSERDERKRKKDKKEKKKKKKKDKKKKKKSSKKAKKEESNSSDSSESESEEEALEFNIDNVNKNISDEEEADKMIIENEKRVSFNYLYEQCLSDLRFIIFLFKRLKNANERWRNWLNSDPSRTIY